MNQRDRNIIALAFGNLEKTIDSLPGKSVKWSPRLTRGEVARLRRRLVQDDPRPALTLLSGDDASAS